MDRTRKMLRRSLLNLYDYNVITRIEYNKINSDIDVKI